MKKCLVWENLTFYLEKKTYPENWKPYISDYSIYYAKFLKFLDFTRIATTKCRIAQPFTKFTNISVQISLNLQSVNLFHWTQSQWKTDEILIKFPVRTLGRTIRYDNLTKTVIEISSGIQPSSSICAVDFFPGLDLKSITHFMNNFSFVFREYP